VTSMKPSGPRINFFLGNSIGPWKSMDRCYKQTKETLDQLVCKIITCFYETQTRKDYLTTLKNLNLY
jgi:hypothetical protein